MKARLALAACLLLAVVPAAAQPVPLAPYALEFERVWSDEALPHDGTDGQLQVHWRIRCAGPTPLAPVATAQVELHLESGDLALAGDRLGVELPDCALVRETEGTSTVAARAQPRAAGLQLTASTLHGRLEVLDGQPAVAQKAVEAFVAFRPGITLAAKESHAVAGPQEMLQYTLVLASTSNAVQQVTWSTLEPAPEGWAAIVPEVVLLEPGAVREVAFVVATPFDNGYNGGMAGLSVVATPAAAQDPSLVGEPATVPLDAEVRGWYVPGPGAAALLALVGGAAAIVRRRAQPGA